MARSSAVSSNGGLRKGGRVSLASLISLRLVFISTSYIIAQKSLKLPKGEKCDTFPRSSIKVIRRSSPFLVTLVTSADIQPCSLSGNQTWVPLLYMFSAMIGDAPEGETRAELVVSLGKRKMCASLVGPQQ